ARLVVVRTVWTLSFVSKQMRVRSSAGRDEAMTITQTIVREHDADLVIQEARTVADVVVALVLADPNGGELPAWTPGAHIDFVLGDDLIRQYSLCSSPSKPDLWRVGVLRAPDRSGGH